MANIPREFAGAAAWHAHGVTGKGVVVAVVDTGVYPHEDLTLIDGWAIDGETPTNDANPYGHGTHVAGIAAGAVYGIAPGAQVLPVKITKGANGTTDSSNLIAGLQYVRTWAAEHPKQRVVVNISFSGTDHPSIATEIDALVADNVPVVVAACNDGSERSPLAEYESPIVVANLESDGEMNDSSSCWGRLTDCCIIGSSVKSCKNAATGYRTLTGTSMASPAMAGIMALILSRWPSISEADAYAYLMEHATPAEVKCPSGIHLIPRVELVDDFGAEEDGEDGDDETRETKVIAGVSAGARLIVRAEPNTTSEKVGNLNNGDTVTVLERLFDRALVSTGTCGWIKATYLADPTAKPPDGGDDDKEDDTVASKVSAAEMVAYYKPHAVRTNAKAPDTPPAEQWGYVMGGDGRVATASYLLQRAKSSYPDNWERYVERTTKWLGRPVYDCNALAEAYYKQQTGVDINTKARSNYANWCGVKSPKEPDAKLAGLPQQPGVAVFSGDSAASITHVGFLLEKYGDGDLDWYVLEARGADYGLVITKLTERSWRWWGVMDKYFAYGDTGTGPAPVPQPTEPYFATCGGNSVNVRTGRGTEHESLGTLDKGDKMLALPAVDGWCAASAEIGGEIVAGYVSAQYVKEVEA